MIDWFVFNTSVMFALQELRSWKLSRSVSAPDMWEDVYKSISSAGIVVGVIKPLFFAASVMYLQLHLAPSVCGANSVFSRSHHISLFATMRIDIILIRFRGHGCTLATQLIAPL